MRMFLVRVGYLRQGRPAVTSFYFNSDTIEAEPTVDELRPAFVTMGCYEGMQCYEIVCVRNLVSNGSPITVL